MTKMKTQTLMTREEYRAPFVRIRSLDWERCFCTSTTDLQVITEEDAGIDEWHSY